MRPVNTTPEALIRGKFLTRLCISHEKCITCPPIRDGLATFRSQTPELVRQELYGFLLAHYLIRRVILEGALQEGEDPDTLSFTHAWHVITRKLPHMVGQLSRRQIALGYTALLDEVREEQVSSSRGASMPRGVRRYSRYTIRGHAPTTPRQKDFTVHLLPAVA